MTKLIMIKRRFFGVLMKRHVLDICFLTSLFLRIKGHILGTLEAETLLGFAGHVLFDTFTMPAWLVISVCQRAGMTIHVSAAAGWLLIVACAAFWLFPLAYVRRVFKKHDRFVDIGHRRLLPVVEKEITL